LTANHIRDCDCIQLTWDLLDKPTVRKFSGRSIWANWPNVQWAARQFWDVQLSPSSEDAWRRQVTWHHLVMTAGNFKRQAPISLPDLRDGSNAQHVTCGNTSFRIEVNGEPKTVKRENTESWEYLTEIPGMGVATATTVLSALWPDYHVIADRRDIGAGIGLAYAEACSEKLLRTCGYDGEIVSWQRYRWFRPKVIAKAEEFGVEAVEVERALYRIDLETGSTISTPWDEYRRMLCRVLRGHHCECAR
jgi:hypothetical protein